ncbi:MAG: 23S rRNA (adenine(2503)-C(2))-methyltransferase RlmN [Verrucomicrobia bacterium]|nr:23S rRNA (adenine(2503)-C(2))-methyltransferase RlmN [Verrucomicrobiota bacterium]
MKLDIKSQTRDDLVARLKEWGEPAYRADQVLNWLHVRRATDWRAMSNLPQKLRQRLAENFSFHVLELVTRQGARDATQKFLWRLHDHSMVESVLIPANAALYGDPSDRHTLCVSTQVGCAYGCKFCASGLGGWKRNLTADEIIEQVLGVERWQANESLSASLATPARPPEPLLEREEGHEIAERALAPTLPMNPHPGPLPSDGRGRVFGHLAGKAAAVQGFKARAVVGGISSPDGGEGEEPPVHGKAASPPRLINNLVVMGMGEPLANYDNLLRALRILNAPWGGGIGARKMTVSTSGLAPEIRRLLTLAARRLFLRLAVSLHAATDEVRNRLMPVNRKYPLRELLAACDYYPARKGRMITFEYILIAGVNDHLTEARGLATLAGRFHAKVNLIPCNRVEGLAWEPPAQAAQEAFLAELARGRIKATLRHEKGGDIDAACGQLRLKTERGLALGAS